MRHPLTLQARHFLWLNFDGRASRIVKV
jgi:hypothetical protein